MYSGTEIISNEQKEITHKKYEIGEVSLFAIKITLRSQTMHEIKEILESHFEI